MGFARSHGANKRESNFLPAPSAEVRTVNSRCFTSTVLSLKRESSPLEDTLSAKLQVRLQPQSGFEAWKITFNLNSANFACQLRSFTIRGHHRRRGRRRRSDSNILKLHSGSPQSVPGSWRFWGNSVSEPERRGYSVGHTFPRT